MKAICKLVTKVDGNKLTITGELMEVNFPAIVGQRSTMLHPVNGHPSHPRHYQANSQGFIVKRKGANGVLFPKDEMVSVAIEIDNQLTGVPIFTAQPQIGNLVGTVVSEIPVQAKIQESTDGKSWSDIPSADQNFKGEQGKHYRCIATNKVGSTTSKPVHIPIPKSVK